MRLHLGFFFGCIALALAQNPYAAVDDILGMLQRDLLVKTHINETDIHRNEYSGVPGMQAIARLEEMVMAKVNGGVTGDDKFAGTINRSVKNLLLGTIIQKAENQNAVDLSIAAFRKCKVKMWDSYRRSIQLEKMFWKLSQVYPKCSDAETNLKIAKIVSKKNMKGIASVFGASKALMKVQGKSCGNVCANLGIENYHDKLTRLYRFYKKCKNKIYPLHKRLVSYRKTYKKKKILADEKSNRAKAMRNKCNLIAYLMNLRKCQAVEWMQNSCTTYESGWRSALRAYDKTMADVKQDEKYTKITWRALKRIECYVQVLDEKDEGKNKKILNGCIRMKRPSTKHLDIDYGRIPPKPICPRDPRCPCTPDYVKKNYRVGPKERCQKNLKSRYSCPICKKRQWKPPTKRLRKVLG